MAPRLTPAAERPAPSASDSSGNDLAEADFKLLNVESFLSGSDISAPNSAAASRRGSESETGHRRPELDNKTEDEETKAGEEVHVETSSDSQSEEIPTNSSEEVTNEETKEEKKQEEFQLNHEKVEATEEKSETETHNNVAIGDNDMEVDS